MSDVISVRVREAQGGFVSARVAQHVCSPHLHDTFTIGLMRKGTAHFSVRGKPYTAAQGELFVIHPYEVHWGGNEYEPIEYDVFYVSGDLIGHWAGQPVNSDGRFLQLSQTVARRSSLTEEIFAAVGGASSADLVSANSFASAIGRLFSALGDGERTTGVPEGECRAVEAACLIIHENATEPMNYEELAKTVGLSRFHFIRLFGRVTGMTPAVYLRQVRLATAAKLISTGLPLVAAAHQSGFADQSHMTRSFKEAYGFTPGQFAKGVVRSN